MSPSAKVVVAARVTRRRFGLDADDEPWPCEEDVEENAVGEARPPDSAPSKDRRRFEGRRVTPSPCGLEGAFKTGGVAARGNGAPPSWPHPPSTMGRVFTPQTWYLAQKGQKNYVPCATSNPPDRTQRSRPPRTRWAWPLPSKPARDHLRLLRAHRPVEIHEHTLEAGVGLDAVARGELLERLRGTFFLLNLTSILLDFALSSLGRTQKMDSFLE